MSYKIALIGSGNVARSLSVAFEDAGHFITEVYSRDIKNARRLAEKCYDAKATDQLDFRQSKASIFIVAVNDDAIEDILSHIHLPQESVIAHTSGTCGIEVFSFFFTHAGVFYPLQSFSPNRRINWNQVPICMEATSSHADTILEGLASSISHHLVYLDSQQRKRLHLGAVLTSNFSNHLLYKTQEFLDEHDLDFSLLKPLIAETLSKALELGPENTQTGPAIRGDMKTIREHLLLLEEDKDLQGIYQLLTESILKRRS